MVIGSGGGAAVAGSFALGTHPARFRIQVFVLVSTCVGAVVAVTRAGTDELVPLLWAMVALIVPRAFTPWLESLLSHRSVLILVITPTRSPG